jgi:hypothetical protein
MDLSGTRSDRLRFAPSLGYGGGSTIRRFLATLSALAVVLGVLAVTSAEAQAQTASLEVRIIVGSNSGGGVDPALSGVAGQLRARFGHYNSFQQVRVENVTLTHGASRAVGLPNGSTVTITFEGMSGSSYRLSVSMPGGGGTLTSPPGGVFFVAGPPHDGGTIIVSVRS